MREIKFRAWHEGNKSFIYATFTDFILNGWQMCEAIKVYNNLRQDPVNPWASHSDDIMDYISSSFMATAQWEQSTGMLDKNGKEIFEGDILHCDTHWDIYIVWDSKNTRFSFLCTDWVVTQGKAVMINWEFMSNYEVIGNIHDKESEG